MKSETKFVYRITYTKGDSVKYISHLDFLRCVNRSFKRAKIPVKYSQGFNPHILLNIGLPCPVGVSSECEMLDIELKCEMDPALIVKNLDGAMPSGIKILSAERKTNHPDFFAIEFAEYDISFSSDIEFDTNAFAHEECVMIEKKSKRGMKEVNIKEFVKEMKLESLGDKKYALKCIISAGNKLNLKPDLLVSSIASYHTASFKDIKTVRKKIFFEQTM
ncbi:MAG: DUF2344 domain-containing protein [Clostridia bacterium]|nr:DUF2344 domain-containing protein [Clostridia bacterium]